ncbi:MAG: metallophosphoesterase [Paracoccaceae bacterium]
MDGIMLENMWKVVKPEDELWIIGDFAFGAPAKDVGYLQQIFGQLPGARKHLIVGNHDSDLTQSLDWTSVSLMAEVPDGSKKQRNTLCHYPMITWNHLKRILGLGRLRLRGPCGVQDEFTLAATAQNLRKLAKLKPMVPATA